MHKPIHSTLSFVTLMGILSLPMQARQKESLLIGPGDLIHVQVLDSPEMEQHSRVTDQGNIRLIAGGEVHIAGQTPAVASESVESALMRNVLRNPRVLITVEEYATQKVTVMGEVKNPGAYSISTPRSILDVITLAGGLSELADRRIVIERHDNNERQSYFLSNQAEIALGGAGVVLPGDTVFVPKAGVVYVLGDVRIPGGYTMTNNEGKLSALQALARAGGANNSANTGHAVLIHNASAHSTQTPLELRDMQNGKSPDIQLEANDIIYIPFSYTKNFVVNGSGIAATVGSAAIYRF